MSTEATTAAFLFLGNHSPLDVKTGQPAEGHSSLAMTLALREDAELDHDAVLAAVEAVWPQVAAAGSKPSWVACTDQAVAEHLAEHFGCPTRTPRVPAQA